MTPRKGTTTKHTITIQRAAQEALQVQDACNLSGVAHSFLRAVAAVNEEAHRIGEGTAWRNNHPIIRLYVDKLASLSGMQGPMGEGNYSAAYEECKALANAEEGNLTDMTPTEQTIAKTEGWDELHITDETAP